MAMLTAGHAAEGGLPPEPRVKPDASPTKLKDWIDKKSRPTPRLLFDKREAKRPVEEPVVERVAAPIFGGIPQSPEYWIVSTRQRDQGGHFNRRHACEYDFTYRSGSQMTEGLDRRTFASSFQPGVPVWFVVHGSFTSTTSIQRQADPVYQWIRRAAPDKSLHVVFFTWPSDNLFTGVIQADVSLLGRRAEYNAFYVAELISMTPPTSPVSLFGHSHGARTVCAALELAAGGALQDLQSTVNLRGRRFRSILAAAALDHQWLNPGEKYGHAMNVSECIVNLQNRHDHALALYPARKVFGHRALGKSGLTRKDIRELQAGAYRFYNMDVTPLIGPHHQWKHYYGCPAIANSIAGITYYLDEQGEQPTVPKWITRTKSSLPPIPSDNESKEKRLSQIPPLPPSS